MQRTDDHERQAQIDMRAGPRLQAPAPRCGAALAYAQPCQPDDQSRADGAERVAVPAAAIVPRFDIDQQVGDDDEEAREPGHPRPEVGTMREKALMACGAALFDLGIACIAIAGGKRGHQSTPSSSRATLRKRSGLTRIAAPVGHARTQAGPPSIPLHMSHLIASLAVSPASAALFFRHA